MPNPLRLRLLTHSMTAFSPSGEVRTVANNRGETVLVKVSAKRGGPGFVAEVGCDLQRLVSAIGPARLLKAIERHKREEPKPCPPKPTT